MNLNELHAKVISVARKNPPSDHVPYAFEKRIMNCLNAGAAVDHWTVWGRSLWRGAVSCVAITILCGLWSVASAPAKETTVSFSQDFEATVFAPLNQNVEDAW